MSETENYFPQESQWLHPLQPIGEPTMWRCPKHGDWPYIGISFQINRDPLKNYCAHCFQEMVAAQCCEVFPAPPNQDAIDNLNERHEAGERA